MDAHLIVTIHDKGYKVITCTEGYCFTDWDGNNADDFSSNTLMYAPLNIDLEGYYCMTLADADIINAQKQDDND